MVRQRWSVVAVAGVVVLASCGGDDTVAPAATDVEVTSTPPQPTSTDATTSTSTTEVPVDDRTALTRRLADELGDEALAAGVVAGLDDAMLGQLGQLAGGDWAGSPMLSYTPSTVPADDVDALFVFSFGNQLGPDGALLPGPTNEELAQVAAAFVAEHPVPVIAQWEVADLLEAQGVANVIPVEPDTAPDGTIVYLSTAGVAAKGLQLVAEQGITPTHAGVLCHADHAVRCLLTARAAGMTADVPEGVDLPVAYDPASGQAWTTNRQAYITTDLLGRLAFTP